MLTRLLKLPFKVLKKAAEAVRDGGRSQPPPPPARPSAPPARARYAAPPDDGGDDHGHSHSHSHGHSHDHAEAAGPKVQVHTEETPNPNAMKFVVSERVVESGSLIFNEAADAQGNALGERLFAIEGVRSVFAVNDFVTVTKDAAVGWGDLIGPVTSAIEDAF